MFDILDTDFPGLLQITPKPYDDQRGKFIKTFQKSSFAKLGIETYFKEQYYSVSYKNVIRGMHFQKPPEDHVKFVYCVSGSAFDVVLDLRIGSPTYLKIATFELSDEKANMLYIPKGFAHGFCATTNNTTLMYHTSSEYNPECDAGILWSSIPIEWPIKEPIISLRDSSFESLSDFVSPFKYA
ncbi:dTDP-4-dehydrorhamnose 3,5-epimerase [Gammaproteobacteria bacterium]|nr:dTDP-4-dehydrorhamnose 3,5-epimerase [Gammaproteobacteria bacterium]